MVVSGRWEQLKSCNLRPLRVRPRTQASWHSPRPKNVGTNVYIPGRGVGYLPRGQSLAFLVNALREEKTVPAAIHAYLALTFCFSVSTDFSPACLFPYKTMGWKRNKGKRNYWPTDYESVALPTELSRHLKSLINLTWRSCAACTLA